MKPCGHLCTWLVGFDPKLGLVGFDPKLGLGRHETGKKAQTHTVSNTNRTLAGISITGTVTMAE